jgi:hypothetical protein
MEISKILPDDPFTGKFWGGVFFHPLFADPARDLFGLKGESICLSMGGNPVVVLNILSRERGPMRTATIPFLFQYFGALTLGRDFPAERASELNALIRDRCDFAIFSFPPDFPVEVLAKYGWKLKKTLTLALTGEGLASWGRDFRDDVKSKIRKSERESIEIENSESFPNELWAGAFARKGMRPPIEPSILEKWCHSLLGNSILKIFVARKDGVIVAFRGELIWGDFAYDWIAGSDPAYHSTGANQLLMAEIGREIAGSGIKAWDLVGGSIKSINDFKRSFGAREYVHYHGEVSYNMKGRLFSVLRRLRHG